MTRRSLDRVISFARRYCAGQVRRTRIDILGPRSALVEGFAWDGTLDGGHQVDAPWIEIFLPENLETRKYPRGWTYRKRAGRINYYCWHEEVLAVVAHELRHVQNFVIPKRMRAKHDEVDSELFAKFVLEQYRLRKRCKHENH